MSEPAATATARGQVYDLLAAVFRRPLDAGRLAGLRKPDMVAAMSAAGIDPGEAFIAGDAKSLLNDLAIDYTNLFHDPERHISPYESLQLDEGETLMGARAGRVRAFMAEVGFMVAPETGELPDHISVELAFMGELARREAEARRAGDHRTAELAVSLQRRFLREHLGLWAGQLAQKIKRNAATPFYGAMADLLSDFVTDDRRTLAA